MSFALPSRRPLVLALQLAFVAAPMLTPALMPAAQAQAAARSYSIPAGTLSRVLSQFAAEAGVLLSVDAALTEGKQSSGLQGSYGVAQGLERILAGSGLEAVPQNSGGYTLRRLPAGSGKEAALATVAVTANSAGQPGQQPKPYAGGQMARGSRVGLLGDLDMMDTPFATAAYTSQLMQDQAAKSVADVVANDPAVRVYRGYGNYAEAYTVRGLPLYADDLGFNGLYGLLPRQYVAVEMLERVEVFRGANAFLNGMASGNSGMGGSINLVPKRAGELPVTQVTGTLHGDSLFGGHVDIGRRFGPDQSVGRAGQCPEPGRRGFHRSGKAQPGHAGRGPRFPRRQAAPLRRLRLPEEQDPPGPAQRAGGCRRGRAHGPGRQPQLRALLELFRHRGHTSPPCAASTT